jgi:hypothetical protein
MAVAVKNHDYQSKDIGYANVIMGIIIVTAGWSAQHRNNNIF